MVSGTLASVKYAVLTSADQNVGSPPRRQKLPSPANVGGLNRFQFSGEVTPAATTGPAVNTTNPAKLGSRKSQAARACPSRRRPRGGGGPGGDVVRRTVW